MLALLSMLLLGACSTLPASQVSEKHTVWQQRDVVAVEPVKIDSPTPPDTTSNDLAIPSSSQIPLVDDESVDCVARAIYFEARGEPTKGQVAVGYVVVNRMNDPRFPNTACGVVHQQRKITKGKKVAYSCEFHWYCDGKPDVIKDKETYAKILEVARQVLTQAAANPVGDALFFHAVYVKPQKTRYASRYKVGHHIFYT